MRAREITGAKLWTAKVKINNPQYVGYVEAQAWAPNARVAREILKAQYRIQDHHVGSVKEVR